MENNKYLLSAKDVSEILGVSTSKAYNVIQGLNDELQDDGSFVIKGKIPRTYLEKRFFGLDNENCSSGNN